MQNEQGPGNQPTNAEEIIDMIRQREHEFNMDKVDYVEIKPCTPETYGCSDSVDYYTEYRTLEKFSTKYIDFLFPRKEFYDNSMKVFEGGAKRIYFGDDKTYMGIDSDSDGFLMDGDTGFYYSFSEGDLTVITPATDDGSSHYVYTSAKGENNASLSIDGPDEDLDPDIMLEDGNSEGSFDTIVRFGEEGVEYKINNLEFPEVDLSSTPEEFYEMLGKALFNSVQEGQDSNRYAR